MDRLVTHVDIDGRGVGPSAPCLVIAEAGVNHNGNLGLARRLVEAAATTGADAVKFQTFATERLVTAAAPKARYQAEATGSETSQREMLEALELSAAAHAELAALAAAEGLLFLSTPFDEESADLLDAIGIAAFKVASPDLTNLPLVRHVARKHKPVILSTGMADLAEVASAVAIVRREGAPLVLLHCVSSYPAEPRDANLRAMGTLRKEFGVPVGFSDHTLGAEVSLAAVALGAAMLEKHLTLDRTLSGPDHRASLEPDAFRALVTRVRSVEAALGDGVKRPRPSELDVRAAARRSLAARATIPAGTILDAGMLVALRPGTGISPSRLDEVIGRRAVREIPAGALLDLDDLE